MSSEKREHVSPDADRSGAGTSMIRSCSRRSSRRPPAISLQRIPPRAIPRIRQGSQQADRRVDSARRAPEMTPLSRFRLYADRGDASPS